MGKMGNTKGSGMPVSISNILREYVNGIKNIFGRDYEKTILYGSYARGDNRLDSDIDIMILVKCDDDMIHEHMRAVRDYTYDINEKYDTEIMPIVKNVEHFKIWIPNYPFYNNVAKEGMKESGYVQDLAKGRLQQVRDDLKSAQLNFSAGLLKAANNRAYYAIFHAVAAVK